MPLSLESIYKPLNDFFLEKFHTADGSQVVFRFDRFGSVVSDDDFIDDHQPDAGPQQLLAREKFSDLVNRAPIDDGDGLNIVLSANPIDSFYHDRLLLPSEPFIPEGADEPTKQSIIATFNAIKAEALQDWEQLILQSMSGMLLDFKPAIATPEDWYDSGSSESWTDHTVDVSEPASAAAAPAADSPAGGRTTQLWRMKVSDEALRAVLSPAGEADEAVEASPAALADRLIRVRDHRAGGDASAATVFRAAPAFGRAAPTLARAAPPVARVAPAVRLAALRPARRMAAGGEPGELVPAAFHIADRLKIAKSLDVRQRVMVSQVLAEVAPTEPVTTNRMSIAFQYCLVQINRPWLNSLFISPASWFVPGAAKGSLTTSEVGGMTLLPIGLVAIRKLRISANWSDDDIAKASEATDLGPFKVGGEMVNNELSHPGLQVIGWLLQKLPELPPFGMGA